ncbi:MAG: N-6 DNA methylase [Gemmatimonadaceae bacterium]|nr:N-6 DNA methylase [Gemmatimonadaceae bacterium]
MLRLPDAAHLLSAALDGDFAPLATGLRFAPLTTLPRGARDALQLPPSAASCRATTRPGRLGLLTFEWKGDESLRDATRRIAGLLVRHAGHRIWCVAGRRASTHDAILAVATPHIPAPLVSALVVRRGEIVDSDVQTVMALAAAAAHADDDLVHQRWGEVLGRDALTGRFYRALERVVRAMGDSIDHAVPSTSRRALAITAASRLLFLSFLEGKGWLDGDRAFLVNQFDDAMRSGGGYHRRILWPLWFGTLNTPSAQRAARARRFGRIPFLNGGLFGRTPEERAHRRVIIDDAAYGRCFDEVLTRYRFTAREDALTYREAAVDPEMLGLAFESLMGASDRKSSGAFYTPPALVDTVAHLALTSALVGPAVDARVVTEALHGVSQSGAAARALLDRARALRVCDPACGSGAFLVRLLDGLATIRRAAGDPLVDAALRRDILARQLHGVDRNPVAVWLCELRLWLAVVVAHDEPDPRRVPPLPNLDRHVRVGDALSGGDFARVHDPAASRRVQVARERYARASGRRKHLLARQLDRLERAAAVAALERQHRVVRGARAELLRQQRSRDLFGARHRPTAAERALRAASRREQQAIERERRRLAAGGALPFAFASHFAAAAGEGGFGLIIGNPPWVRPHRVDAIAREAYRHAFRVARDGAWPAGSGDAAPGFGAQVDLAALFTERGVSLLRRGGVLAFVLPTKLWRSLAGAGWRALIASDTALLHIQDWSEGPATFDAAVYPGIVVLERPRLAAGPSPAPHEEPNADAVVLHRSTALRWQATRRALAYDDAPGSPWLLLPPAVRRAFDALRDAGPPLGTSPFRRPTLGVKCGCNEAFVVERTAQPATGRAWVHVRAGHRSADIERRWVRPLVRGETLDRWRLPPTREAIVFPHHADETLSVLPVLPPDLSAWLGPWRNRLVQRSDVRASRSKPWWALFRTDGARSHAPRVIWSDFGRAPKAAVLPQGSPVVPLNTCYVLAAPSDEDALALAALLNSAVIAAWLGGLAEPARGGWRRFLGWTVAQLPLPRDWSRAVALLAPLAEQAWNGTDPDPSELWHTVAEAYGVRPATLRPLLEWDQR